MCLLAEMDFSLVQFTDEVYHIAGIDEIRNEKGSAASVYWKKTRTCYSAEYLEHLKNNYEKDEVDIKIKFCLII